ncbi:riboflavin synthase [Nocardioides sp. InS609-2]|uniref:riboflavin synthase n=1 Tax=Nocardioides sp. InS609-2 TaxID=2760705 RepID=UPI0020C10915|nr:riboflavin synthase [Nocardioides sp. InS609-2]
MFTGIVEELGTVAALERLDDAARITIDCGLLDDVHTGDSIAVNGCCLTVTEYDGRRWTADVMQESLNRTSLGALVEGDQVNLERAMPVTARLGGHIVQGHVDGVGTILARHPSDHWDIVEISLPPGLAPLLVDKGSIAVDGVSLTVVTVTDDRFSVSLIPETLARTTFGTRAVGDRVNLEADVLAKHVARLVTAYLPQEN